MRTVSAKCAEIIEGGSFDTRVTLTAFYGSEITLEDVPVSSWSFDSERGRDVPTRGTVEAVYNSDDGSSVGPRGFTDALAPFGQEVVASLVVSAGRFTESIMLGRFRIVEVPEVEDSNMRLGSTVITTASRVKLVLADGLEKVRASGFTGPTRPRSTFCWPELAVLTGMQIFKTLTERNMPTVEYELAAGGRLDVCQRIADELGGTLYVRPDGSLTVLPDAPGPVVKTLTLGEDGLRLSEVQRSLSTEQVFNEVVGTFEDADRNPIVVPAAQITEGPLSVNGPLGRRTHYEKSDFVKTLAQAREHVKRVLAHKSTVAAQTVPVTMRLDPRLEIGDTIRIEQDKETVTGSIESLTFNDDGTMVCNVKITGTVPALNLGRLREVR